MNTEKETQVNENTEIIEENVTEEITDETAAETSAETYDAESGEVSADTSAETDTAYETDAVEENGKSGIGVLLPIGTESEDSESTGTVELTGDPHDEGFFGNLNISSTSLLCIALAIVSVILIILVADKFRAKKSKEPKVTPANEDVEAADTASPAGSVTAAYVHGIGAREDQQDSYSISDLSDQSRGVMAVVADGMGGLSNGSLVSGILARTFKERFRTASVTTPADEILIETALYANMEVNQALANAGKSGSTLVSVIIRDARLHFLTVGDSHLYLYRNGALLLLNREHVYSEELAIRAVNRLTPVQQIKGDRQSKSLTSYFGIGNLPHMDRSADGIKLVKGDKILLCSDGVYGTLDEKRLEDALSLSVNDAAREIEEGIKYADSPYQDNYTALILEYNG